MSGATNGLSNRSKSTNSSQVRSNCKLCPDPVLTGQDAKFIADPPGLSHTPCIEARERAAGTVGGGHRG